MIGRESPLRKLPAGLDRHQALSLDGIRHAAEIVSLAYTRLQSTLTRIAMEVPLSGVSNQSLHTSAFLDAWSVVDAVDRFRALWGIIPKRFGGASVTAGPTFAELSQPIRNLRNVADHLAQRIDYVVAHQGTALGVLGWFTMTDEKKGEGMICTLMPGTIQAMSTPVINPVGQAIEMPTGLIHLSAGEYRADLSAIIPEMIVRIRELESELAAQVAALKPTQESAAADVVFKLFVKFDLPKEDA